MWSANYTGNRQGGRSTLLRIKIYLYAGSVLIIIIGGWYLLSQTSLFRLKKLEINGLSLYSKEEFLKNISPLILRNNIVGILGITNYLAWPNEIKYTDPAIAKITLKKDFWDKKITLQIEERQRYGIWCQEINCTWFDGGGFFFGVAPATEGFLLHKISGDRPRSEMANILHTLGVLEEENISVKDITFNKGRQELQVETPEGARIILSTRFDPTLALISAYENIIKKIGWGSIEYLDLTVENRIYYQ